MPVIQSMSQAYGIIVDIGTFTHRRTKKDIGVKYTNRSGGHLEMIRIDGRDRSSLYPLSPSELCLVWFGEGVHHLRIDSMDYTFHTDDVVCLTEFNKVSLSDLTAAKVLRWNKGFYCVINHDSEVGCRGVLFYGATELPIIRAQDSSEEHLRASWQMLEMEMRSQDSLQEEMLQMMLKRILILCTRIYKDSGEMRSIDHADVDIIREYNFLVEQHFREKHTVAEYAELLHKSPKTLSNVFKKLGSKSPLQYIKDRRALESRRNLVYTNKTVSEIGYELGFTDIQSFSRFFKKEEGQTPLQYRKTFSEGKN